MHSGCLPGRYGSLSIAIFDLDPLTTWPVASQIFSGKTPFYEDLDATVICRVLRGDRPSRPNHAELPDRMRKIVEACWDDTPSRRMAVGDVVTLMEAE